MLLPKLGGSRLLPPWDFPHLYVRVTLWTTTAFHLDTPNRKPDEARGRSRPETYTVWYVEDRRRPRTKYGEASRTSLNVVLQDVPYLVHRVEIIPVAPDLVGISSVSMDIRLDDLRYGSRPR